MISSEIVCFMMSIIPWSNTSWAAMWKECIGVMEGVFAPQSIKSYRCNYSNFHRIHILLCCRKEKKKLPADCIFCAFFSVKQNIDTWNGLLLNYYIQFILVCNANIKYNQKSHVPSNMFSLKLKGVWAIEWKEAYLFNLVPIKSGLFYQF